MILRQTSQKDEEAGGSSLFTKMEGEYQLVSYHASGGAF
jgi:hypothetical protein